METGNTPAWPGAEAQRTRQGSQWGSWKVDWLVKRFDSSTQESGFNLLRVYAGVGHSLLPLFSLSPSLWP